MTVSKQGRGQGHPRSARVVGGHSGSGSGTEKRRGIKLGRESYQLQQNALHAPPKEVVASAAVLGAGPSWMARVRHHLRCGGVMPRH